MKKTVLCLLLITLSIILCFGLTPTPTAPSAGDGSSGSPYQITSLQNLYWIAQNSGEWGKYYIQTANIDATGTSGWDGGGWTPIGTFTGSYNGNGHTITGITIDRTDAGGQGLFASKGSGGTVSKLGVINASITVSIGSWQEDFGILAGSNNGTIEQCFTTGSITISGSAADVGGFVGENHGVIIDNKKPITNCYSKVEVRTTIYNTEHRYGSFVGYASSGSIGNCYSTGNINDSSYNSGFAGNYNSYVDNTSCFWHENSGETSSISGTKKTIEEMKNATTTNNIYLTAGWDFKGETTNGTNEIWNIGNGRNDGYPYLSWEYSSDPATLPVTLSSFTGIYTASNMVSLVWTTQSESNMIGYHVLRADDQELLHAHIVTEHIIPSVNFSTEHSYSFTDKNIAEESEYYYWLQSVEMDGSICYYGPIRVNTGSIIVTPPSIPVMSKLHNAYPNPFNPSTNISFEISSPERVKIDIYNAKGQLVKQLVNREYSDGRHSQIWNGKDTQGKPCGTGTYYYTMQAGKLNQTKKMMLIK